MIAEPSAVDCMKVLDSPETNKRRKEEKIMTNVKYAILHNNKTEVARVDTWGEAKEIVKKLGKKFTFKTVYETFDPNDTPQVRKDAANRAKKIAERLAKGLGLGKA